MAAGDITYQQNLYAALSLLVATGTNAKPAGTEDGTGGYDITGNNCFMLKSRPVNEARLIVKGVVTAGQTLAGTYRLWGYNPEIAEWVPLHAAVTIAETDSDKYGDTQVFTDLIGFTRFHVEAAATGTGAALTAYLLIPRKDRYTS